MKSFRRHFGSRACWSSLECFSRFAMGWLGGLQPNWGPTGRANPEPRAPEKTGDVRTGSSSRRPPPWQPRRAHSQEDGIITIPTACGQGAMRGEGSHQVPTGVQAGSGEKNEPKKLPPARRPDAAGRRGSSCTHRHAGRMLAFRAGSPLWALLHEERATYGAPKEFRMPQEHLPGHAGWRRREMQKTVATESGAQ